MSKTPVQKTNLFHFFERTPASVNKQVSSTPLEGNPTTSSDSSNLAVTPFLTKIRPPTTCPACNKIIPFYKLNDHLDNDCLTSIPTLASGSSSPSVIQKQSAIKHIIDLTIPEVHLNSPSTSTASFEERTSFSPAKLDFSSPPTKKEKEEKKLEFSLTNLEITSIPPSTPTSKREERKYFSSSKKNLVRRKEIAGQIKERLTETDVKKYASRRIESNANGSSVKRKLFFDEINKPKVYQLPYYLETFLFLLKSTFNEPLHQHLFIEEDHRTYSTFKSLSLEAQKLYVRLFSRKFQWRRKEKIVYEDIASDLAPALAELVSSSLLLGVDKLEDLPLLLGLLTQIELKQLFKEAKIPFNGKGNASQVRSRYFFTVLSNTAHYFHLLGVTKTLP